MFQGDDEQYNQLIEVLNYTEHLEPDQEAMLVVGHFLISKIDCHFLFLRIFSNYLGWFVHLLFYFTCVGKFKGAVWSSLIYWHCLPWTSSLVCKFYEWAFKKKGDFLDGNLNKLLWRIF